MKQGGYDLGHYVLYFILVIFALAIMLGSLRFTEGRGYYEILKDKKAVQEYLFARTLVDCLAPQDQEGHVSLGRLSSSTFANDQQLKGCTSEPVRLTLKTPTEIGVRVAATTDALKQASSLRTIYREYVLVDGQRSSLLVEVQDA